MTVYLRKRALTYILLALLAAIPPFLAYRLLDGRAAKNDPVAALAGKNYRELKRVLNHYSRDKADSLKLKAARFLIDNMSYHIGVPQRLTDRQGNEVEFDFSAFPVGDFKRLCAVMDSLGYRYERGAPQYDIQVITADYLIENIDDAFTAWEYPWAKHLGFDDFCENVLPYRGQNEPLSNYRKQFMEMFSWLPDSLKENYTVIDVVNIVKRHLEKRIAYSEEYPLFYRGYLTPFQLEMVKTSACENLALYFQLALRSLGIPAHCDNVLAWRHRNSQHIYNSVTDRDRTQYFLGLHGKFSGVIDKHLNRTRMWRVTYKIHNPPEELARAEGLHPLFINPYYKDITSLYAPVGRLEMTLNESHAGERVYLCVFNFGEWRPLAYTLAGTNGNVMFPEATVETIYRVHTYNGEEMVPLTPPFRLDSLSNIAMLIPDTLIPESVKIDKLPAQFWIKLNSDGKDSWFTLQYLLNNRWVPIKSESHKVYTLDAEGKKVFHTADDIPPNSEVHYEIYFSNLPANALLYWGGLSKPFSVRDNKVIM